MLPSQELLEAISRKIQNIPNHRKESKRKVHYCLFLLGHKAGLRVSEAVNFDLANKTRQGLYRIERPKGKKERLVYIPKKVIRELRKNNWQPNQTNRWNFYHFLKKIKRELGIVKSVEITPHTLRHAFATYHAENGLSLPILSKMLGHASIRTTALYWQNIYQEPDNYLGSILVGKKWLERPKPSQKKKPPTTENFPELLETSKPIFIDHKPLILNKNPTHANNSLSIKKTIAKTPEKLTNEISPSSQEKFLLNNPSKNSDQLKTNQPLPLTANQEQNPTKKEQILLQEIKLLEKENSNLKAENQHLKQLLHQEKQRANQAEQHLQKISQQLDQEKPKVQIQIIQSPSLKLIIKPKT